MATYDGDMNQIRIVEKYFMRDGDTEGGSTLDYATQQDFTYNVKGMPITAVRTLL